MNTLALWAGALLWLALSAVCLWLAPRPEASGALLLLALGALAAELAAARNWWPGAISVAGAFYVGAALGPVGPAGAVLLVLMGVGLRTMLPERVQAPPEVTADPRSLRYRLALLDGLPPLLAATAVTFLTGTGLAAFGAFLAWVGGALLLPRFLGAGRERPWPVVLAIGCAGGALGRLLQQEPWWGLWMFPVLALVQWLMLNPGAARLPGLAARARTRVGSP